MSSRRHLAGLLAAALLVAGCGGKSTSSKVDETDTGPQAGKTASTQTVDAPRIVKWVPPKVRTVEWQLAIARLSNTTTLTYRVPGRWKVERNGASTSGDGIVKAHAEVTDVSVESTPLSDYVDQLAGTGPTLQLLHTADGSTAFIVERRVEVAPEEPTSAAYLFHTAIMLVDGHAAKFELRYPATDKWRFGQTANAVLGTISLQRT